MAFTIPAEDRPGVGSAASPERAVLAALRTGLPDDCLVYQNAALTGRAPTFIVIGPDLGVMVLDVHDLGRGAGASAKSPDGGTFAMPAFQSPVENVRSLARGVATALRASTTGADGAELSRRVGQVVVLAGSGGTDLVMPDDVVFLADLQGPDLHQRLRRLAAGGGTLPRLDASQIDAVRSTLYPELRVSWGRAPFALDREQDRIVHLPEEGRYLVDGPAGSGKTASLIARVRYLRQRQPQWRILMLCFSRVVVDHLREALGPDPRLHVLHFHSWCWQTLDRGGMEIPTPETPAEREVYWEQTIPQLMLSGFKANRLAHGRAEAILVDDGHDFHEAWYGVLLQALLPATNSLLIMNDPRQLAAGRPRPWHQVGISIAAQHLVLRANYRVRHLILGTAEALTGGTGKGAPSAPGAASGTAGVMQAREGFAPDVRRFRSAAEERQRALVWLRQRLAGGVPPEKILMVGLLKPEMADLEVWLEDLGVPSRLIGGRSMPGVVRLSTIHGAKGLEADYVLMLHAHQLEQLRPHEARQLLYTVVTRARVQLNIYYHGESRLLEELEAILNPSTIAPWAVRPSQPRPAAESVPAAR